VGNPENRSSVREECKMTSLESIEAASRLLARVAEDTEMAGLSDTGFKQSLSNAINGLVELL
jgi:hypothetical protein